MRNLWSEGDAQGMSDLDKLVYLSRCIGADPSLVVWGGGNTSIKVIEKDFRGVETRAMRIKGSGSDMKTIERRHFPRLRLDDVDPLLERDAMSDEEMVAYLDHCVMDPGSPRPSIETLLHAFLPFPSVAHSHADAVVALTNNLDAATALQRVYGDDVAVVEYVRPGFHLSKLVALAVKDNPQLQGVVLVNHGLFTWGDSPKAAYDQHIALVSRAEDYAKTYPSSPSPHPVAPSPSHMERGLGVRPRGVFGGRSRNPLAPEERRRVAAAVAPTLRGLVGQRQRMVLRFDDSVDLLEFVGSADGQRLSGIGPATPDHLVHSKRRPLWLKVADPTDAASIIDTLRRSVPTYADDYARWYQEHTSGQDSMLDPYPRVVLLPGVGMWTTGRDARAALIAGDIYHHTINVIGMAQSVSEYTSLTAKDAYEAEYWPLELYKLTLAPPEKELARQVALVTGAANGIGKAIAQQLAAEGAHLVVTDIDTEGAQAVAEAINRAQGQSRAVAFPMDVADEAQVAQAFQQLRLAYGGLDILVSNAGIAPVGAIDALSLQDWQRSLDINTTGHFLVAREAVKALKEQATGGSLVFIGTKNVPAPGSEFGAYSASKAAAVQLARVLALENGQFGIRSNVVNPDAVFQGSRLWSEEVRRQRAAAHGVSVDQLEGFYQQRNLLKAQVLAEDVAEAVLFLTSNRSSKTTGAMLPVDAGVREAFPR